MAEDIKRWIYNPTYNETVRRDQELAKERQQVDRKVIDAKQELRGIEQEMANQTSIDRKELDFKLARERERLLDGLENLDEEIRIELGRQNVRFREQIDSVRLNVGRVNVRVGQMDQKITNLADQFNNNIRGILSRIKDKEGRARAHNNQFQLLLSQIAELHPDKLAPDKYETLIQASARIETNINNGDFEAATGVAQTHMPNASHLMTELEFLNDEFSQLIIQIHERCKEISERIDSLSVPEKNKEILTYKEDEIEFDGRISFWSNGVFDGIIQRFERVCQEIRDDYEVNMDIESLRQALGTVSLINQNLDECVCFSHNEYIEYYEVQLLTQRIHSSLAIDNTWNITNSGFADNDERRSYSLSYDNGAGLVARFVVMPNRSIMRQNRNGTVEYGETKFRMDVFDQGFVKDESLCDLTRNGILERLRDSKIDIGDNATVQSSPSNNQEEFVSTNFSVGDKAKDGRMLAIKDKMGL